MSSSKRRPDKQRRNRRNRAKREALERRSRNEGEATAIAGQAGEEPEASDPEVKKPAARPVATDRPIPIRDAAGRLPGQRAVTLAFMFSIVSAGFLFFLPLTVEEEAPPGEVPEGVEIIDESDGADETDDGEVGESGNADETTEGDENLVRFERETTVREEFGVPATAVVGMVPIAICGVAWYWLRKPRQARAWTICLVLLAGYIFLVAVIGTLYLPAMIALTVGAFQARRVEQAPLIAARRAAREEARRTRAEQSEADGTDGDED